MKPAFTESRKRRGWTIIALLAGLLGCGLVCVSIGPVRIPFLSIPGLVLWKLGLVTAEGPETVRFASILFDIRLPRVILGMLVGSALGVSGGAMQAVFRNPMASPYVVGISSGASFGAALAIVLGLASPMIPTAAFSFALATAFLVYGVARVGGKVPVERLLLSGIAVSLLFSALLAFTQYAAGEQELREIVFWLMGGLWAGSWEKVYLSVFPILIASGALMLFPRELNVMLTGEETALDLGVEVEKVRVLVLVLASLATAAAVCMVGVIGFVGLIVPHAVRLIAGPDHRVLLPASALGGAVFLILTDLLARTVLAPAELPVGILTALFGVPFFLFLLRRRKKAMGW